MAAACQNDNHAPANGISTSFDSGTGYTTIQSPGSVPEPSTLVLLLLTSTAVFRRRR